MHLFCKSPWAKKESRPIFLFVVVDTNKFAPFAIRRTQAFTLFQALVFAVAENELKGAFRHSQYCICLLAGTFWCSPQAERNSYRLLFTFAVGVVLYCFCYSPSSSILFCEAPLKTGRHCVHKERSRGGRGSFCVMPFWCDVFGHTAGLSSGLLLLDQ